MARKKKNKITSGGLLNQPAGGHTIILSPAKRWFVDIESYIRSVTEAERVDFPNWAKLQDLYTVALTDAHLFSVMEKRKSAILSIPIEFSRNGKPDEKIAEMIDSPWFRNFLSDILDAPWLGPSLFQFYMDDSGWLTYDLIPRKHIDPVNREIRKLQSDVKGVSWDEYSDLLFVGKPREIGNLVKAIPWVLYKNGTTADWAQFAEIFGQPIREYTYDSADDKDRQRVIQDAYDQGASSVYIHPTNTTLKLIESGNKTGSSDLYHKLVTTCNAEISKLFLGNTLTTEASETGTQALGTVQQKGQDQITLGDKIFALNVLNYQMTDIFESFGYNVKGGKFTFVTPQNKDLSQRILIDTQIATQGVPIADDYWYDAYGIPKPDNYDELKKKKKRPDEVIDVIREVKPEEEGEKKEDEKLVNRLKSFFGEAPKTTKGALGW
ncbi:DUF935 domain-containing protein [Parabacteroides sp. OttesenSCG-928-B22]|nr:DUF935 domain-containing protein [Parabacteroides sp. OttesenSCG-928-B22]